jgi:hypothetical protein
MLKPPPLSLRDFAGFADWLEVSAAIAPNASVSRADAEDVLRDESLLGIDPRDLFPGDLTYRDMDAFSDEDAAGQFVEELWQELGTRSRTLQDSYPFSVTTDMITLRQGPWSEHLCYITLLLADIWRAYDLDYLARPPFPRLFEKLVEASGVGLFRGTSIRFGVPKDDDWPVSIENRVSRLGDLLRLETENLAGKLGPNDGDRGLDVASRISLGDDGPATIVVLTQCATGLHWKEKTGEPSIAEWRDIFRWNAKLVRAIAVPWRLSKEEQIKEFRRFDEAVIVDRFRLLAGLPDQHMAAAIRDELTAWCSDRLVALPRLE